MPIEIVKLTVLGTKNQISLYPLALLRRWFSFFPRWDIFQFPSRVRSEGWGPSMGWPLSGVELRMEANDDMDIKLQDVAWEQKFGNCKHVCFDFLYYGYEIDVSNVFCLYICWDIWFWLLYVYTYTAYWCTCTCKRIHDTSILCVFFWSQPVFVGYPFMRPFIGAPHVERS